MSNGGGMTGLPPLGGYTQFSGIPWTVTDPSQYYGPTGQQQQLERQSLFGFLGGDPFMPSGLMTNPRAQEAWGAAGGIMGELQTTGAAAVKAATGAQGQLGGYAGQLAALGRGVIPEFNYNDPYAQQALQQGFDPLNAQRKFYQQQLASQLGAQAGQSGYAGTPYAGEVAGAGQAAFLNQWALQALQREQTAAQTATGLQAQELAAQQLGGQLINEAGQLDAQGLSGVLQAYGVQGQNLSSAVNLIGHMFDALKTSVSQAPQPSGG